MSHGTLVPRVTNKCDKEKSQGQIPLRKDGLKSKTGFHTVGLLTALNFSNVYSESERWEYDSFLKGFFQNFFWFQGSVKHSLRNAYSGGSFENHINK